MNLYKKLILSLVGLTSIILIATLLLARWSFEQGFQNFLQNQEMDRLNRIAQDIVQVAPSAISVSEINKPQLSYILDRHALSNDRFRGPRGGKGDPGLRRPPPHLRAIDSKESLRKARGMKKGLAPPVTKDYLGDVPGAEPKKLLFTAVYDESGNLLAGNTFDESLADRVIMFEYPISNDNKFIGTVKSWKQELLESPTASEFAKQQITTSILIGFFSLSLAFVLSYFGAKTLLAPIRHIMSGVEDLSKGNYTKGLSNNRVDEFGDLINNVNHLGEVLEQTKTAKNRWFADISHELRTPLTVLMGELEALKLGIRPFSMEQLDSLSQETQLLKRLIDDLYQLSVSDIGALRYEFAKVDISALLSRVVDQTLSAANANSVGIAPNIKPGVSIECDEDRIHQLFTNVLNNSATYTNTSGKIKVTLDTTQNDIVVRVEDSAPNLSEEECAQIFEPLYRHDKARTRNAGGAGLGLAISKNIVHAHGGKISAKPSIIGGIEVTITLPFVPKHLKRESK